MSLRRSDPSNALRRPDAAGVTLPELMIALTVAAIAAVFSLGQYFQYQESVSATRAARAVSADLLLARSLAIRGRVPVSLVATESQRQYVVRDTSGTMFHRRDFGNGAEIELTALDVQTTGDSITFDPRGLLVTAGTPVIGLARRDKARTVTVNALGRTVVN